jgi:protein-arginine kinase
MQKVNLCDACSKEKGVQDPTGFALADLLLGIGAAEEIEKGAPTKNARVRFYPGGFQKNGSPWLQRMLRHFRRRFGFAVKAMHKGTEHVGKLPQRAQRDHGAERSDARAHENLQKAVAEENYESAASLRDQIKQLETEAFEFSAMKFSNMHGDCGGMAARRRAASPGRESAAACARAQFAQSCFSRMGEESGAHVNPGTDQAARGRAAGDAGFVFGRLAGSSALEKQVLVERHLISREHAAKGVGSAVVMNRRQTLSIMINEEDHLRMQSIRSGLAVEEAFKLVDKIDSTLESKLDFAYDPRSLDILTACPTNVGTGMRASAMLHLPGLVLSELINQVIQAVNKIGLAVRGLYGEGTEAMGNLFQISNQTTLGEKEEEIINRLSKVIETIIEKEHDARQTLIQKKSNTLWDQIGRAYGVLTYAHAMTSKEALNLLVDHQARRRSRRVPGRSPFADRRIVHRNAAGASAKELATEVKCGRARLFARPNHPRAFESLP